MLVIIELVFLHPCQFLTEVVHIVDSEREPNPLVFHHHIPRETDWSAGQIPEWGYAPDFTSNTVFWSEIVIADPADGPIRWCGRGPDAPKKTTMEERERATKILLLMRCK